MPPISAEERGHGKLKTERKPEETAWDLAETPQKLAEASQKEAKTDPLPSQRALASERAEKQARADRAGLPWSETEQAPTEAEKEPTETEQMTEEPPHSRARSTSAGLGTRTPAWAGQPGHERPARWQEGKARLETPGHSPQTQTPKPDPSWATGWGRDSSSSPARFHPATHPHLEWPPPQSGTPQAQTLTPEGLPSPSPN